MEMFQVPLEFLWFSLGVVGGYIIRQLRGNGKN